LADAEFVITVVVSIVTFRGGGGHQGTQ